MSLFKIFFPQKSNYEYPLYFSKNRIVSVKDSLKQNNIVELINSFPENFKNKEYRYTDEIPNMESKFKINDVEPGHTINKSILYNLMANNFQYYIAEHPYLNDLAIDQEIENNKKTELGVFAGQEIPSRKGIGFYIGEYKHIKKMSKTGTYGLYLCDFSNEDELIIDPSNYFNFTKFMNHSRKNPNVEGSKVVCDDGYARFFFTSIKKIKKGEELLWDYKGGAVNDNWPELHGKVGIKNERE